MLRFEIALSYSFVVQILFITVFSVSRRSSSRTLNILDTIVSVYDDFLQDLLLSLLILSIELNGMFASSTSKAFLLVKAVIGCNVPVVILSKSSFRLVF